MAWSDDSFRNFGDCFSLIGLDICIHSVICIVCCSDILLPIETDDFIVVFKQV